VFRVAEKYVKGYSDSQAKVNEATSNDPWGPTGAQMREIADLTYNEQDRDEIIDLIVRKLNLPGKDWRQVLKALVLLEYCLINGSVIVSASFGGGILVFAEKLKKFTSVGGIETYYKDQGAMVRQKAQDLSKLLQDADILMQARRARGAHTVALGSEYGDFQEGPSRRGQSSASFDFQGLVNAFSDEPQSRRIRSRSSVSELSKQMYEPQSHIRHSSRPRGPSKDSTPRSHGFSPAGGAPFALPVSGPSSIPMPPPYRDVTKLRSGSSIRDRGSRGRGSPSGLVKDQLPFDAMDLSPNFLTRRKVVEKQIQGARYPQGRRVSRSYVGGSLEGRPGGRREGGVGSGNERGWDSDSTYS